MTTSGKILARAAPRAMPRNQIVAPISGEYPLVLVGRMGSYGGYDLLTYHVARQLYLAGIPLRIKILNGFEPPEWMAPICRWNVLHGWEMYVGPPDLLTYNPATANVVLTMWESGRLSANWIRDLSLHSRLVVLPCEWCMTVFDSAGIRSNFAHVPLGYDPAVYNPGAARPSACTFGSAASLVGGGKRKNIDQTIRCFLKAFPREENVCLKIKITPRCELSPPDDKRIVVMREDLPLEGLADWYKSLTAFVSTSHGEGFGMHMIEAMACGRPVVSPRFGGVAEYLTADNGYPVDYSLVPARCDHKMYRGLWCDAIDDSLVDAMRDIYARPDAAAKKGLAAAAAALDFTWDAMGCRMKEAFFDHGICVDPEAIRGGASLDHPATVVVLTWNAFESTQKFIESFVECPLAPNADFLFVDNGSTDQTIPLLRAWEMNVIRNQSNVGYTKAVNQGIAATRGDVVLMNNDTAILHGDWLHRLQEAAYASCDVGLVGCRIVDESGGITHCGGKVSGSLEGCNLTCRADEYVGVHEFDYVTFACVYIKRSTIDEVGLLDEDFFAYYEDTDYCRRVRGKGLKVVADSRAVIMHAENASSKANGVDAGELVRASYRHFVKKWATS